ncbi:MAG: sensor histidine kinase [Xenococcaceae cyanobacterium]
MVISKEYVKKQRRMQIHSQQVKTLEMNNGLNNREIYDRPKQSLSLLSLLCAVLESAADGIIALSYWGEVFSFNQKLLEIWNFPNSSIALENSDCFFNFCSSQLKDPDKINQLIGELNFPSDLEASNVWELNNGKIVEFYSKPLTVQGENLGRVWSFRVSKDIHKAEQLNRQLDREKELSEQRSKFISMVSHEFRVPLTVISFAASLLRRHGDRCDKKKKNEYFDRLQSAVEQLNSLMDEVLTIGKAESGSFICEPKPTNLSLLCQEIVSEIHLQETDRDRINFVDRSEDKKVSVDKKILRRILTNLLSNAIKYSPFGEKVDLILSIVGNKTILQVKDRGIGIPDRDRHKLFESFYRASNVGDLPGHGLGLAIVKKLVDIHGGQISVESEVNKGTTFSVLF